MVRRRRRSRARKASNSKRWLVASIYRKRAKEPTTRTEHAAELVRIASELERCRDPYRESGRRCRRDSCRLFAHCPECARWRFAKRNRFLLQDYFGYVPLDTVYFLRFSLGRDRVPGHQIRRAVKRLDYAFLRLRQSRSWEKSVSWSAGVVHRRWKPQSQKHGSPGFWVHLHMLIHCRSEPDLDLIGDNYRRILALPHTTKRDGYFNAKSVTENLPKLATYMTHVDTLLPGYRSWTPAKGKRRLDIERMPVADIFHFADSVWRTSRLRKHNTPELETQGRLHKKKRNQRAARIRRGDEQSDE